MENSASIIEDAITKYRPTAIIAVTQDVLTALMIVLKKLHYKIPDDISVIAYDENPLSQYENITTIGHNIQYIGTEISRFLLDHLLEKNAPGDAPVTYFWTPLLLNVLRSKELNRGNKEI